MTEKRRIRRTPLVEKIKSYPYDLFLWINETISSIDWDDYNEAAKVGGSIITLIFIILNKVNYNPLNTSSTTGVFQIDQYNYDKFKKTLLTNKSASTALKMGPTNSFWFNMNQVIIMILYGVSIFNFLQVAFKSFRTYNLLNVSSKPKSPNVLESLINENSDDGIFVRMLTFIVKLFNKSIDEESFYNDSETTGMEYNMFQDNNKVVYHLKVWEPLRFQLIVLAFFNPINLFVAKLIIEVSMVKIMLIVGLLSVQTYFFTEKFLVLLNDKQILYQQMFKEYNDKYVKPKVDILRKDVAVDATPFNRHRRNDNVIQTNPYFQNTKLKVFITHDINGKPFNSVTTEELSEERKQIEAEKIRLELERNKINQSILNSTLESDWLPNNLQSTPYKQTSPFRTGRDNRSILSTERSLLRSPERDTSRASYRSPERDTSRISFRSPDRPTTASGRYKSPDRSFLHSPERSIRQSPTLNRTYSPSRRKGPTYDRFGREIPH